MLLGLKPARPQKNTAARRGYIDQEWAPQAFWRNWERALAGIHAKHVGPAVGQLFVNTTIDRYVCFDIVAIDAVQLAALELPLSQKAEQLVGEEDIQVRG